jgi:hypothetical protein
MTARPAAWVGRRPVAVCVGGPLDGRWYFVADLEGMQAAARRMGHTAEQPAGVALAYDPTPGTRTHPAEDVLGAVWRHAGAAHCRERLQLGGAA